MHTRHDAQATTESRRGGYNSKNDPRLFTPMTLSLALDTSPRTSAFSHRPSNYVPSRGSSTRGEQQSTAPPTLFPHPVALTDLTPSPPVQKEAHHGRSGYTGSSTPLLPTTSGAQRQQHRNWGPLLPPPRPGWPPRGPTGRQRTCALPLGCRSCLRSLRSAKRRLRQSH